MEVERHLENPDNSDELLSKTLEIIRDQNALSHELGQLRSTLISTTEQATLAEQRLKESQTQVMLSAFDMSPVPLIVCTQVACLTAEGSVYSQFTLELPDNERDDFAKAFKVEGNKAFQIKEFSLAVELYSRAIEVTCNHDPVFFANRAACYLLMTPPKYQLALVDCNEAIQRDKTYVKAINRRGLVHEGLQQHEAALHDRPNHLTRADSLLLGALEAMRTADLANAYSLVDEALDLGLSISWRTGRAMARTLRGTFRYLTGDLTAATTDFLDSLSILPAYTQNYVKLAKIRLREGDREGGFKYFEAACLHDSDDPDIYHHRGLGATVTNHFDGVEEGKLEDGLMAPDPQCTALAAAKEKSVCTGTKKPTTAEFNALAQTLNITAPVSVPITIFQVPAIIQNRQVPHDGSHATA
ncbi:hypothetical protein H0H93_000598 [Arthromyces matolae]|nr:hypothetical protein H0H93_000598 [Arthromyces matolae]